MKLFLYNNGGLADLLLSRILYRKLLELGCFQLQIGVCRNRADLYADLRDLGAELWISDYHCLADGAPIDLAYLCPPDSLPLSMNLGDYEDTHFFSYEFVLEVCRRRMEEHGIALDLPFDEEDIPLLDLRRLSPSARVQALLAPSAGEGPKPGVYIELRRTRDGRCRFFFDLPRLAQLFPDLRFFCTQAPPQEWSNLIDVSDLSPLECSLLSEGCDFLLGRTFDPFALTLTEANRFKPKALCGYDARKIARFYPYPGDPTEYVRDMDELVDLLQSVFPACPGEGEVALR